MTACGSTCTILGACLHMMVCGSIYMMGSISPYLASYFQVSVSQSQILLPLITVLVTLVMPFGAQIAEKLHPKTVLLLGASIATVSAGLASLVPRTNFYLFAALLTGGLSVCIGLSYTSPIKLGWVAMPQRSGLVSGLIIGGFGLGSLVFTQLGTMIVNPDNLDRVAVSTGSTDGQDSDVSTQVVFPEVVALRVPVFLRWLALCYALLALLTQLLVHKTQNNDDDGAK